MLIIANYFKSGTKNNLTLHWYKKQIKMDKSVTKTNSANEFDTLIRSKE